PPTSSPCSPTASATANTTSNASCSSFLFGGLPHPPSPLVGEGPLFLVQRKSRVRGSCRERGAGGKSAGPHPPFGHLLPQGEKERRQSWRYRFPRPTAAASPHAPALPAGKRRCETRWR